MTKEEWEKKREGCKGTSWPFCLIGGLCTYETCPFVYWKEADK
jgi:hypothetical protein